MEEHNNLLTADDLLNHSDIESIIHSNVTKKNQIVAAASLLAGKPQSLAAMKKAVKILLKDKIHVFLSYKREDKKKADEFIRIMHEISTKIKIDYDGNFGKGKNWRDGIDESIREADWLFLLLPDPSTDWDWCLFETGVFYGQRVSEIVERLICFHHDSLSPPDQISQFKFCSRKP